MPGRASSSEEICDPPSSAGGGMEYAAPALKVAPSYIDPSGASRIFDETTADRKSTRLNSSHRCTSYAVSCLKKKSRADDLARTLQHAAAHGLRHVGGTDGGYRHLWINGLLRPATKARTRRQDGSGSARYPHS